MDLDKLYTFADRLYFEASPIVKSACVVGSGTFGDSVVLVKDRDRNYTPHVQIVREMINDVEVAYMIDLDTDWSEGMNSLGIGLVNAALMVGQDENEKKLARKGKKSADGEKFLDSQTSKNLYLYLIPEKVIWKGIKNKLPKGYEPTIDITVFKYEDMEKDSPPKEVIAEDIPSEE